MSTIFLEQLQTRATVGIFEWERQIKQLILLDIEMSIDTSKSATLDSLNHTVNYKALAKRVKSYVEKSSFSLIETLAEKIAILIINEFEVTQVKVKLSKPAAVRHSKNVGIIVEKRKINDG